MDPITGVWIPSCRKKETFISMRRWDHQTGKIEKINEKMDIVFYEKDQ